MTTTIKITELTNIGANLASSTVIPVVNMAGTPTTEKTVLGNIANVILAGAGGNYVSAAKATTATTANTVLTNAQPNITSMGNLTGLTVSNATGIVNFSNTANVTLGNVSNLHIAGGTAGQILSTNGNGTLSWASDTTTYGNSNVVTLLSAFGSNTITTTGNISGGNLVTGGQVVASGNVSSGTGLTTGGFLSVDGTADLHNTTVTGYANVTGTANTVGGGATVGVRSILSIDSTFGSNSSADPASAQAVRGRVTGANLTKTRNYVTGVTGQYLITGTNASEFIKAGVLGVVGDQTTTADGAVVAYLDGDGGLTTANAAYAVSMKNSTPNSGFNYGLDLQFINLNVAGTTTTFKQADIRFNNGVTLVANTAGNISINANVTVGNIIATNIGNISNINLTGNASNVLYGNGVFASIPAGANTGNVTFNDINIIGTGNLKLQPDSATGESLDIYLTAADDIHIAGSGNIILGTDEQANVAVLTNGNVAIQAGNVSGTQTWNFGTDGNLTLPRGGVVYETNIPDGGLNGNTIALAPSGGTNADQQLLIYPTTNDANHLHLTSGNLYSTELFLGDDNLYVKLANTGNIVINSNDGAGNTAQWTFDVDGNLTIPGSLINDTSIILSAPAVFNICTIATAGSGYNTGSSLKATTGGSGTGMTVGIGYGLSNQLTSVSVVDPGTGYVNGDVITVSEGTGGTFVLTKYNQSANQTNNNTIQTDFTFANSTVTLPIYGEMATDASMTLTTNLANAGNTSSWIFGDDGSLTLPIGVSIDYNGNVQYPTIMADSGKLFSVQGQGNTGSAALAWTVDPNAASQYAAVAVNRAGGDNLAKVVLQAQSDSGNVATVKLWKFDETGNLTLPGNTFAVNYANGTQVSLGSNSVAEASFSIQNSNFNANVGGRYGVNTSAGAVTSTLPTSPSTGGAIFFADAGGAFASNNLTINPNGQTIMGASGNMTVSNNNQSFGLFFNGSTWRTYN